MTLAPSYTVLIVMTLAPSDQLHISCSCTVSYCSTVVLISCKTTSNTAVVHRMTLNAGVGADYYYCLNSYFFNVQRELVATFLLNFEGPQIFCTFLIVLSKLTHFVQKKKTTNKGGGGECLAEFTHCAILHNQQ